MLGTESTLRSGHLLLLLLVASSIILGFSYLNEMYQRIQLQTELAIVEKQTQHAVSERLVNQHKLSQLQMKIEVANQEKKRLQDMHEFQTQKQNAYFEKEKQEFLNSISLKEEAISELQAMSIPWHMDNISNYRGQPSAHASNYYKLQKFHCNSKNGHVMQIQHSYNP
ncbi:Golgi membrane protein 1-like [Pyxicephalus adspersus]|uniref:Golgi membrane protein 1-like n=1 Tax=Pyxicephalus adspersus TaxID=30357 RepID=UPI003B5C6962